MCYKRLVNYIDGIKYGFENMAPYMYMNCTPSLQEPLDTYLLCSVKLTLLAESLGGMRGRTSTDR